MSETMDVHQSRVTIFALCVAQNDFDCLKIHFVHTVEEIDCLCAVESCSHGASGPENFGDCIRALLGQCWGLLAVGLESAQKVQRVFEALKLLFIEQVSTSLCLEEQIPFFTAKVVAFLSRRGSSIGPSDEKNC